MNRRSMSLPDLTFPHASYGTKQVPLDLTCLLYRGGAATRATLFRERVRDGSFGKPLLGRLALVKELHEKLSSDLEAGGSPRSIESYVQSLRAFFAFIDHDRRSDQLSNAELVSRFAGFAREVARKKKSARSHYTYCVWIARTLAPSLGLSVKRLLLKAGIQNPDRTLPSRNARWEADQVFLFMRDLRAICEGLSLNVVQGPIPIDVALSEGRIYRPFSGLHRPLQTAANRAGNRTKFRERRERLGQDTRIDSMHRSSTINLRLEAELLIFIQQTGANFAQAIAIPNGHWRRHSRDEVIEITCYKNRAHKFVSYRVHKEFGRHFDSYRAWRNQLFGADETGLLFPFVRRLEGARKSPQFYNLRRFCKATNQPFISPAALRTASGNWMENAKPGTGPAFLGNSDPVFRGHYKKIQAERAHQDITRFWRGAKSAMVPAVGAGACVGESPIPRVSTLGSATLPDCRTPGGCLFCEHNRDLESFDHVWQLVSHRALVLLEIWSDLPSSQAAVTHPRFAEVEMIAAKLGAFRSRGGLWPRWVDEAEQRASVEDFHPLHMNTWEVLRGGEVNA